MSNAPQEKPPDRVATAPAANLAVGAGLLALGSAAGRVLGLAREMVIAALFGATGEVSAFRVAAQVPVLLYDFLVGGMLSAALVPVLSSYAQLRARQEFAYVVGVLLTLFGVGLGLLVLALQWAAPQLAWLLAGGFDRSDPTLLDLTARLIRWTAPAVWLLGMAGLATAALHALQRFSFPALATAVYNLGIVLVAPLLAPWLGIVALVAGMLAGGAAQLAVMVVDLRRAGIDLTPRLRVNHPALRRILFLYAPIAGGLVISLGQVTLDRRLASATGEQSIAWMANATTLQQMPLGLISVAVSLAALPQLSRYHAAGDPEGYRATLGRGLRLVLLLIVPAALLLWLMGEPLTRLLFERARFTAADTAQVTAALAVYVVGMLFAAVDYPLNFAFYARNNTWLPAAVGVISVGIYVLCAMLLMPRLGYLGLVWADTAKQAGHALIMLALVARQVGGLATMLGPNLGRLGVAAALSAGIGWAGMQAVAHWLAPGLVADLAMVVGAGGASLVVYLLLLHRARVPELTLLTGAVAARLGRRHTA